MITGLSGCGKSSLAFDTIYAEGQRRYVESLSAYARQFLGQMEKPDVDQIDGLSPAISIDQKGASRNPRSTVGTVTEIYDYLRLLFARIGHPHCPKCGREIERQTVSQIVDQVLAHAGGHAAPRPRPADQGPQDRGRPGLRGRPQAGLRPRPRRRRAVRPARRRRRSTSTSATRSRSSSTGSSSAGPRRPRTGRATSSGGRSTPRRRRRCRTPTRRASPTRSRRRSASARAWSSSRRRRATTSPPAFDERRYSRALQLPVRRHDDRRARAALVLVQLAARRLPHLHRPRHPARHRPGPGHPGPLEDDPRRRARALEQDADRDQRGG